MFSFTVFLLFWVRAVGGKSSRQGKYFSKRKVVSLVGFGFNQMWKISNAQVARSAVTSVLKKLSQLSGKVVIAIMRHLSQLS